MIENYDLYLTTFRAFAKHRNPCFPNEAVERLATVNWGMAGGSWKMARCLAGKQAHESGGFKLAAWVSGDVPNKKLWPRYDPGGAHWDLIWQEARRCGLTTDKSWKHSDDFDRVKEILIHDPTLGAWLTSQQFVKVAKKHGLEKSLHWWQSGHLKRPKKDDPYIMSIRVEEKIFDSMRPDAPRKVAVRKQRRKR